MNKEEIIRVLKNFDECIEKAELIKNPYGNNEDFKKILVYLTEEHCSIFKDTLDYIKNIEKENQQLKKQKDDVVELIKIKMIRHNNEKDYHFMNEDFEDLLRMLGEIDE